MTLVFLPALSVSALANTTEDGTLPKQHGDFPRPDPVNKNGQFNGQYYWQDKHRPQVPPYTTQHTPRI